MSLPLLLQSELGLDLRVPSSVMCTCMPAGAAYKPHLDSYAGRDNPRLITCLLYLAYDPPTGGALRMLSGGPSTPRDIFPHPGRLCVFFSQELKHEVRPSEGHRRYAMTLWNWQKRRDESGR